MWLRGLVAVTCLAVLAAVGYYFIGEWRIGAENARVAEVAKARDDCLFMLGRYAGRELGNPDTEAMLSIVEGCVDKGLISAADINAARDNR